MELITIKSVFVAAIFFVSVPLLASAQGPVIFDIREHGAKSGADIREALETVWKLACDSNASAKIVIPPGTWTLSQAKLHGPSKAPMTMEVMGTVEAYSDVNKMAEKEGQWLTINYLDYFTLTGGGVFDGKGEQAWKQNDCSKNPNCPKLPINLSFNFVNNTVIRDITTKDSKNFHTNCIASYNVTFDRYTITAPGTSINTDGIHIGWTHNISVINSVIGTGDDCISVGDDTTELHIQNVTCGPGHGISIGSLGKNIKEKDVTGVYVQNCTFIGTDNGVRIKTWPSAPATLTISDLHFEDLIMNNVSNPVVFDQQYCPYNLCDIKNPSLIQISKVTIKNVKGTARTAEALTFACSSAKPCADVQISDIDLTYASPTPANFTTVCQNIKPQISGVQNPPICATPAGAQSA